MIPNLHLALKAVRIQSEVSQKSMSKLTGRTQPFLSMIENGKKPPNLRILREYSSWCKVPIFQIVMVAELWDKPLVPSVNGTVLKILAQRTREIWKTT